MTSISAVQPFPTGDMVKRSIGQSNVILGLPQPLLMDYDPITKTYHPENKATFLFVTREGTTGILQLTGLVTELHRPEDFGKPFQAEPPDPPGKVARLKMVRGFYRGVQIQYSFLVGGDQAR